MLPLRILLIATLSVVGRSSIPDQCTSESFKIHHNSPMMASLQCYNDFTSQIHCTWEEEKHTHAHVPVSSGKPCVPDDQDMTKSGGKLIRSCVYKTGRLSWGTIDFSFNISCPSKGTTFNIATQGKVLPPINFSEKKQNGGNRLLSWSSPYSLSSPLARNLTYQLSYRRHGHDWIVVDDINITKSVIESQALLPGYSYEARVRARGPVGLWSDWSPKVVWMTKEEGVINLQCVIKETGVVCSWQVMKRQAELLSYLLCGRTNGKRLICNNCTTHTEHSHSGPFRDFTCLLESSEPELLTLEIRTLQKAKQFSIPDNIQPPCPLKLQANKKDGIWKLNWERPKVRNELVFCYEVYLESNVTKDKKTFNVSEADLSTNVPSSLRPSTGYMARVRAVPIKSFTGRPSDWSNPIYFTTDPAPWTSTIIYIFVAVIIAVLFIILYTALPACHRRLVRWNISIPSPINSKVLGEMSSKKFLVDKANLYTGDEKTSVCIIQNSDNPIICKGSISEYPFLTCSNDTDVGLSMKDSGWPQGLTHLSLFVEGSRMTDKSGISFTGPYILCREDSSVSTESSDTFLSSLLTLDDSGKYIPEGPKDSFPIKEGYVLSPPKNPTSECSTPSDNLTTGNREARKSDLLEDDPPAYTPGPSVGSGVISSHPSGYCLMPNVDTVAAWVSDSVPPQEGNTQKILHEIEGGSNEHSYVTISQRVL